MCLSRWPTSLLRPFLAWIPTHARHKLDSDNGHSETMEMIAKLPTPAGSHTASSRALDLDIK